MNLENQIARKVTLSRDFTQGLLVWGGESIIEIQYRPHFQDYILGQSQMDKTSLLRFFQPYNNKEKHIALNSQVRDFLAESKRLHHLYSEIQYCMTDGHTCHVTIEFETSEQIHLDWQDRCCPVEWWKIERFFNNFLP
ncbi:MAG: hypothetical protein AAGD96_31485, partial [Chloroflexota bacterium]